LELPVANTRYLLFGLRCQVRRETRTAQIAKALEVFSYDFDGNLLSDGIFNYQWDAENRLTRAETTSLAVTAGIPHRVLTFVYDYRNRRVEKKVIDGGNSSTLSHHRFIYDDWDLIAEVDATGSTVTRSFTWGLDMTGSLTSTGGVGALLQIRDDNAGQLKTLLPSYDGNGNVVALTNDSGSGAIEAVYEYSPFGELIRAAGGYADDNPFRFSTKFTDEETGLVYYGHRYYDSRNGRFINKDPIAEAGGLNLYGFVGNDGINSVDYLGLDLILHWGGPYDDFGGIIIYFPTGGSGRPKNKPTRTAKPTTPRSISSPPPGYDSQNGANAPNRAIARQDSVMAEIIDDIFNIRGVNRVDYERERELRAKYGKYIDYVYDPDNPSIIFASAEEANTAAALLAAVRGGAYMKKKHSISDGEYHGERSSYGSEEYIWGIVRVDGGFRPTRAITNGKGARVDPTDNPAIIAGRSARTLAGIGHNHPPGDHPEVMSGYGDYGSYRGDRNVAENYRVPIFMTSPSGTHYRGTANQRPVPVTAGPSGRDFHDLIGILTP
jgi:RHS repeat-associated protein